MFGYSAFGERSFGELAFNDSAAVHIIAQYFSDHGFISAVGDVPASRYFDPVVMQPLLFFRNMAGDRIGGIVSGQAGSIELNNTDGGLDALLQNYGIDGRRVVVKMGSPDFSYDDYGVIFDGIAAGWESSEQQVIIRTQDKLAFLNRLIQPNVYAGTGGLEGGSDLKGKPKPLCFGKAFNLPAIPVDTVNLIYQVHDGKINSVTAVYDRGVALVKVAGTPAPGEYQETLSTGTFKLGGAPAGQITADVEGDADPSYLTATSDIIKRVLKRYGSLADSDLDLPTFGAFFNDNPASVGIWIDAAPRLLLDVIDELLDGVGGFICTDRFGRTQVGVFKQASGQPDFTLTTEDIIEIEQEALPAGINPPNWRRQVAWQQNYTVQTDIAGSVSAARRAFISEPWRAAAAADAVTQARHLFATDPPIVPGLYANETDALAEAQRLLALYKGERRLYRVKLKTAVYDYGLNDVVNLTYPRWDLAAGKLGRIVAIDIDAARNEAALRVFI